MQSIRRRFLAALNSLSAFNITPVCLVLLIIFSPDLGVAEKKADVERPQSSPGADVDGLVSKARERGSVRVIVRMNVDFVPEGKMSTTKKVADQRGRISRTQDRVINSLAEYHPKRIKKYKYTPQFALEADSKALLKLISDPLVLSVQEDIPVPPALDESVPLIGADTASDLGYTGAGWTIAILDTGVDKQHDFLNEGKVVSEACFSSTYAPHAATSLCPNGDDTQVGPGSGANCSGIDGCAHGTHVAGIAAGKSATINGVAKDANIIAVQVFSRFNSSTYCGSSTPCVLTYTSDQISALEHVYSLRSTYNIASVNMSLGGGKYTSNCDTDDSKPIIDTLRSVGIATIIASGNNGYADSISAPSCISTAVSVGATTKSNAVATYSNSASFLQLLAPGSAIYSSIPGDGWASFSGTSMATPHVAGAWAILKQKNPVGGVGYILDSLLNTGTPVIDSRNNIIKPRIDVNASLASMSEQRRLFATKAGFGTGSVNPNTGSISWIGNRGTAEYELGTQVTLTPAADEGAVFEGWSGDGCTGTGPCTIIMNADRDLTATFRPIGTVLTITSDDLPKSIPDYNGSGANSTLTVPDGICMVTDLNITLGVTHSWIGDLVIRLTHQDSGSNVTLFNRSCDISQNENIIAEFDDEALTSVDCPPNGTYLPAEGLNIFDGIDAAGEWTLNVSDHYAGDGGTLDGWAIILTCAPVLRLSENVEFWHTSIQTAYDNASDGDTVLIRAVAFSEALSFNREGISVLLQGGADENFEPIIDEFSIVTGIEIRNGTVEIENIIVN